MNRSAIDWAREEVLASDRASVRPETVLFLLREYVSGGADAVRDAAEQGLTHGLSLTGPDLDPCERMQWLRVFAEGAAISDDERLKKRVSEVLPSGVDALEGMVRRAYEPGEGLSAAPARNTCAVRRHCSRPSISPAGCLTRCSPKNCCSTQHGSGGTSLPPVRRRLLGQLRWASGALPTRRAARRPGVPRGRGARARQFLRGRRAAIGRRR